MIELDLLILLMTLSAGFAGGVGYRAWRARERSSFRPLRPPVPHVPRLPMPPPTAAGPYRTADHTFAPFAAQARHAPDAPCFVCGRPIAQGGHENCG